MSIAAIGRKVGHVDAAGRDATGQLATGRDVSVGDRQRRRCSRWFAADGAFGWASAAAIALARYHFCSIGFRRCRHLIFSLTMSARHKRATAHPLRRQRRHKKERRKKKPRKRRRKKNRNKNNSEGTSDETVAMDSMGAMAVTCDR